MKLRFFVIAYGEYYVGLYERIAVRSLTQTKNKAAIPIDAIVSVYSDAEFMPRVAAISERLGIVEPHVLPLSENAYDTQNRAFIEEVGRCVREDAALVIVNPDCFWGDGSLANLLAIAGEQNVCVASPHVRVDRDKFLSLLGWSVTRDELRPGLTIDDVTAIHVFKGGDPIDVPNPDLVTLAMQTLHQSWIDADVSKERSNTYHTGIAIRRIGNGLHAVSHLQPTVFFARLNARDYGFFAEHPQARGLWDHAWPATLIEQNRYRVVASSDAVFIAELTDAVTHNTELRIVDPKKPDDFFRDAPHITANRNIVGIWREASV